MNKLGWIGAILTLGYLLFISWYAGDRLNTLDDVDLNNLGDFLAGVFGPIAIMWLVLGFFQQGKELKNSVEALELQASELKNSVAALETQSAEMRKSAKYQEKLAEAALEQLKHEREMFEVETERVAKRDAGEIIVSPRYEISKRGTGDVLSRLVIFDMVNVGGPIAHANWSLRSASSIDILHRKHFWDRGQHENLTIQLHSANRARKSSELIHNYDGILQIEYVDRVRGYVREQYRVIEDVQKGSESPFRKLERGKEFEWPDNPVNA